MRMQAPEQEIQVKSQMRELKGLNGDQAMHPGYASKQV